MLNGTIPVVFIGRNRDGFWVARDAEAKFGGLFWRKQAALDFAKATPPPADTPPCFRKRAFELDMRKPRQSADRASRDRATPAVARGDRLTAVTANSCDLETTMTLLIA